MSKNVKRVTFRKFGDTYHRLIFGNSLFEFHGGSPYPIEYYKPYPFLGLYKVSPNQWNLDKGWFDEEEHEIFHGRIVNGKRVKVEFIKEGAINWERWRRNENWRTY